MEEIKRILGLDLGTTSIGWALVNEDLTNKSNSEIIKLGVRVNPLTIDEQTDFEKGKPLSTNADRTLKRGARRNLQRFKLRRNDLINLLVKNKIIKSESILTEVGKNNTFQTLVLRAKSAVEIIELEEFARVLLTINKKRGYKSSRKAKNDEEGSLIDGMSVAKELYDNNLLIGEFVYEKLKKGEKYIPDFYRSDLQNEFDAIWNYQKQFYNEILTDEFYLSLKGQGQQSSRKRFLAIHQIYTAENKGKREDVKLQHYKWRSDAIKKKLLIEEVAYVLVEINNNLNKSSGYLGAISDRSKELYFNKETVGQNLLKQILKDSHTSLKNKVFYRQDYLDEFEKIWETQAKEHKVLTKDLKIEIRDIIIFHQRKLKSQKHLISECEFEKHHKTIPKSSPLFQEFKIWQNLNNLEFENKDDKSKIRLDEDERLLLFNELNLRGNLTAKEVLNLLNINAKKWNVNFKTIEGNRTNEGLYNVYQQIVENEGFTIDWATLTAIEIKEELTTIFKHVGINTEILDFDYKTHDKSLNYQLWHLLYSAEDDDKINAEDIAIYGNSNVSLKKNLQKKYGFKPEYGNLLANVSFQQDYGSLSSRAIKKIMPFLEAGHEYSEASQFAGYNHSKSLTAEELAKRTLNDKLTLLKKNSLRNPVVEKILNQMVNVVNEVIDTYGKPDEIRIELARNLKQSSSERENETKQINDSKRIHEGIYKLLQKTPFFIKNPTRNDIIRYKLYEELSANNYKSLYTNQYIPKEKLFSKEIDIEHIIPQAKLFDDSFSNKTLAYRNVNLNKKDSTAYDFISVKYPDQLEEYEQRIKKLTESGVLSKAKSAKLLMPEKDIPDGFIDRDLRNTQYIAKKAKELLETTIRTVNTTTGKVTDELRSDWDLINVMQELNLPKFKAIDESLIEKVEKKDGSFKVRIKDWSKRNDHRHHAMDALTVAFTTHNHVQYLNNLNARKDEQNKRHKTIQNIENKIKGNGKFIPPMVNFREEAKKHIESILISFKAKNKITTKNKNKIKLKGKNNFIIQETKTPRGQLHKETVYGKHNKIVIKEEKINASFDKDKIMLVTKPSYKIALLKRLEENANDPKKAFTGKNALSKNPIYFDENKLLTLPEIIKTQQFEEVYTIRKDISPDLKIEKVIDPKIRAILQKRLDFYRGNSKEAFSNLEKNPIWLNQEKGIAIKKVSISGVSNVEALHYKKDHFGNAILNENGEKQAVDFVSTGNNHHVAIYKDENGKLQESVVSFYEAVARVNKGFDIIDRNFNKHLGWEFLFTMKQNEMFIFPTESFNPNNFDLMDEKNKSVISKNLFRVQKLTSKDYFFRHHLETTVEDNSKLKDFVYKRLGLSGLVNIIKIRINHLGNIVKVGEY